MLNFVKQRLAPHIVFLVCLLLSAAYFGAISRAGTVSWNDSGMYINILKGFVATHHVDLIYFCQPTYIGMLPLVLPWVNVFGLTNASLQAFNIVCFLFGMVGVYLFALPYTKPWIAACVCMSLLCFGEIVLNVPTFMTDIVYITGLIYLLLVTRLIENRYRLNYETNAETLSSALLQRRILLWSIWFILLVSTILVRSYNILFSPLILLYFLYTRGKKGKGSSRFAITAFLLSCAAMVLSFSLLKMFTIHPMPLREVLVFNGSFKGNDFPLIIRLLAPSSFLITCFSLTFPVLLFVQETVRRNSDRQAGKWFAGALILGLCLLGYRFGSFWDTAHGIGNNGLEHGVTLILVLLSPFAGIRYFDWFRRLRTEFGKGKIDAATFCMLGLIAGQMFAEQVVSLPYLRHFISVYVLLVLLLIPFLPPKVRDYRTGAAAAVFIVCMAAYNLQKSLLVRKADVICATMASQLESRGVPQNEINAGWSWFARNIYPDAGHINFDTESTAKYQVSINWENQLPSFLVIPRFGGKKYAPPLPVVDVLPPQTVKVGSSVGIVHVEKQSQP